MKGESPEHKRAKARLVNLLKRCDPHPNLVVEEYVYQNPWNFDYPWRFDVFGEWSNLGMRIAIEVDGKIGHYSPRSYKKREKRTAYLKTQGIELYGFPTSWIIGKKALPDSLFYEEMHLK